MLRDIRREYSSPGVFLETSFALPERGGFCTGVPLFLGTAPPVGYAHDHPDELSLLTAWPQFAQYFGPPEQCGFLAYAVRGFFENGGERCYVLPVLRNRHKRRQDAAVRNDPEGIIDPRRLTLSDVWDALEVTASLHTIDLICVPDLVRELANENLETLLKAQFWILEHCQTVGGRFVILDTFQNATAKEASDQWSEMEAGKPGREQVPVTDGAIYYPWITVPRLPGDVTNPAPSEREAHLVSVPPCGHIAGVYARTDRARGVHKAPANQALNGVLRLDRPVNEAVQDFLNPKGINCIRAFPGRGIRVWGARTLSGHEQWRYVSTRRVFLTAVRWIQVQLGSVAFEPITSSLWGRIERELFLYLLEQFRRGALVGQTPEEAFYVKCNEHTNPPEVRERGEVIAEIGLATSRPFEFVVVRLIHGATGVSIAGQTQPWETKRGE